MIVHALVVDYSKKGLEYVLSLAHTCIDLSVIGRAGH